MTAPDGSMLDNLKLAGFIIKDEARVGRLTRQIRRQALYWHYPHYHGSGNRPSGAVRAGDYKLIEWYEDNSVELYNLRDDVGEKDDQSGRMPEKAAELRNMLQTWRKQVKAKMPKARKNIGSIPLPRPEQDQPVLRLFLPGLHGQRETDCLKNPRYMT